MGYPLPFTLHTFTPSPSFQTPAGSKQVPEQKDEARQHEALVDEPVRVPDIPLRVGEEHRELGHHDAISTTDTVIASAKV